VSVLCPRVISLLFEQCDARAQRAYESLVRAMLRVCGGQKNDERSCGRPFHTTCVFQPNALTAQAQIVHTISNKPTTTLEIEIR